MSVLFSAEGNARQVYDLPMDRITVNPDQPRKTFDDYALLTLAFLHPAARAFAAHHGAALG